MFVSFYFAPAAFRIAVRNRPLADPTARRALSPTEQLEREAALKEVLPPAAE